MSGDEWYIHCQPLWYQREYTYHNNNNNDNNNYYYYYYYYYYNEHPSTHGRDGV